MEKFPFIIPQSANKWHLLTGILMIILGFYMWFNPIETLIGLAIYIGIAFIVIGCAYMMASFSFDSGWYLTVGALDIAVGVIMIANLGVSIISFPIIFAVWILAVGPYLFS